MEWDLQQFTGEESPDFEKFKGLLGDWARIMRDTPQRCDYHAEGDVLTHTEMVCRAMTRLEAYRQASPEGRLLLYLTALFHDIGKPLTTEISADAIHSPGHAGVGTGLTRAILWRELGLCGTPEKLRFREQICNLIRWHSLPPKAETDPSAVRKLIRAAADGALIPGLTVKNLCVLSEADVRGRCCPDQQRLVDHVEGCRKLAREIGCFEGPFPFRSDSSRYAYLSGRSSRPDWECCDDTWGQVLMVCGMPGTGKREWVRQNGPDLPVISQDAIRRELKLGPMDNPYPVMLRARELALEMLRKKQEFIWIAPDLTEAVRKDQVTLFTGCGASVKLLYLETDWDTLAGRNPEAAKILGFPKKPSPPSMCEACQVQWLCI